MRGVAHLRLAAADLLERPAEAGTQQQPLAARHDLEDADVVELQRGGHDLGRALHQLVERQPAQRRLAERGHRALMVLGALELGDVLGEALDPGQHAARAEHRPAARPQDPLAGIRPALPEVQVERPALADRVAHRLAQRLAALGRDRRQPRLPVRGPGGGVEAGEAEQLGRPAPGVAARVPAVAAEPGELLRLVEPGAAGPQARLRGVVLGDVDGHGGDQPPTGALERVPAPDPRAPGAGELDAGERAAGGERLARAALDADAAQRRRAQQLAQLVVVHGDAHRSAGLERRQQRRRLRPVQPLTPAGRSRARPRPRPRGRTRRASRTSSAAWC